MIFVIGGALILGCIASWWLRQYTLQPLEIVFDDGSTIEGYMTKFVEPKDDDK